MKPYLWDYDEEELKKTEQGRIFILERMLNYGPHGDKINLADVKKYWGRLQLTTLARRFFSLLIWGKYRLSPKNKDLSFLG